MLSLFAFSLLCWLSLVSYARLLVEKIIQKQMDCVLLTDDVTIMTSATTKISRMFRIKFPPKRIFWFFLFKQLTEWRHFVNLFIERPSYRCSH